MINSYGHHLETFARPSESVLVDAVVKYEFKKGGEVKYEFAEIDKDFKLIGVYLRLEGCDNTWRITQPGVGTTKNEVRIVNDKARAVINLHDDARSRAMQIADTETKHIE